MSAVKEHLIAAIDEIELDELADLLEDYEEEMYWWIDDMYPDTIDDEEIRSMLLWLHQKTPRYFSSKIAEFIMSDCVLRPRVMDALGVVDDL